MNVLLTMKRLSQIGLYGPEIRDEHLAVVGKMKYLRRVNFAAPNVGAAGMAQLENIQSLEALGLYGSISDQAISQLSRLRQLKMLDLLSANVHALALR
jgi:hypothetical protein